MCCWSFPPWLYADQCPCCIVSCCVHRVLSVSHKGLGSAEPVSAYPAFWAVA